MKPDKSSKKKITKPAAKSPPSIPTAAASKTPASKASAAPKAPPAAAAPPPTPAKPAATPKAKAAPKKVAEKPFVIPAILLEGDHSPTPATSGPGNRYALGPTPPSAHAAPVESPGDLPEAYGTKRLLLTARDPHWLYARWDLTREQQRSLNSLSIDRHLVLRIYTDAIKGEAQAQVHVHPESTHWFVHVPQAGVKYLAELGYYVAAGKWVTISTSAATLTPPDTMSEDVSADFATIPTSIPFAHLREVAQTVVRENIPLVEIIRQLTASGQKFPGARIAAGGKWTPQQQRALEAIITMDSVRRVWMGSLEITELIRRQLQQEISSMGAGQFSAPSSPLGGISSITSISSPFGGQKQQKGFWFNVNAELIIYGATEPDAQVTIGDRVIKLRSDGTFSYRFALPDGQYELPAVAVSADKTDSRAAELSFERATEYRGEVGAHPQDPRLKPPLADHVA